MDARELTAMHVAVGAIASSTLEFLVLASAVPAARNTAGMTSSQDAAKRLRVDAVTDRSRLRVEMTSVRA